MNEPGAWNHAGAARLNPPGDWDSFTVRLAGLLASSGPGMRLIIASIDQPNVFVQFAMFEDGASLRAEHPGRSRRFRARAAWPASEAAGWSFSRELGMHVRVLDVPARVDEYRSLAQASTIALRDVQGVMSPAALDYTLWVEPLEAPQ